VRLAFAVAAHVDADVLIIDEALGVGDARFQLKCARAIDRFLAAGVTLLFVSHDPSSVKRLCSQAILLEQGRMVFSGRPNDVINLYSKLLADGGSLAALQEDIAELQAKAGSAPSRPQPALSPVDRVGTVTKRIPPAVPDSETEALRLRVKALEILLKSHEATDTLRDRCEAMLQDERKHVGVSSHEFSYGGELGRIHHLAVHDQDGQSRVWFASGETVAIKMTVEAAEDLSEPIFALTIKNTAGVEVYGTNTAFSQQPSQALRLGEWREITFQFQLDLMPGHYFLSFGFTQFFGEELLVIHRRYDAVKLEVHAVDRAFGIANLHAKISEQTVAGK